MSLNHRYDFVLLFDVKDGNPNGDPDTGNLPRFDNETGHGLVIDVCLKRKVRNFVEMVKAGLPRYQIFVREKAILNHQIQRAYHESEEVQKALAEWQNWKKNKKNPKPSRHYEDIARDWMCDNFFDVRAFGAVMSTGDKEESETRNQEESEDEKSKLKKKGKKSKLRKTAGQVRGPIQLTFSRSVDPIAYQEHSITRMAVTSEKSEKERTMGRKYTVPYGLYRCHGFVSAFLAEQTGFSEDDLELFFQALCQMFEHDRSAARGEMTTRGLYVFKHASKLGNAPAYALFDRLTVKRKTPEEVARSFDAYEVLFDGKPIEVGEHAIANLPNVTLIRRC